MADLNFKAKVMEALAQVPMGFVTTYGDLARAAGKKKAARAVGNILGKNQDTVKYPCHRVICADGRLGGYGGGYIRVKEKINRLEKEGVFVDSSGFVENFQQIRYVPPCILKDDSSY